MPQCERPPDQSPVASASDGEGPKQGRENLRVISFGGGVSRRPSSSSLPKGTLTTRLSCSPTSGTIASTPRPWRISVTSQCHTPQAPASTSSSCIVAGEMAPRRPSGSGSTVRIRARSPFPCAWPMGHRAVGPVQQISRSRSSGGGFGNTEPPCGIQRLSASGSRSTRFIAPTDVEKSHTRRSSTHCSISVCADPTASTSLRKPGCPSHPRVPASSVRFGPSKPGSSNVGMNQSCSPSQFSSKRS